MCCAILWIRFILHDKNSFLVVLWYFFVNKAIMRSGFGLKSQIVYYINIVTRFYYTVILNVRSWCYYIHNFSFVNKSADYNLNKCLFSSIPPISMVWLCIAMSHRLIEHNQARLWPAKCCLVKSHYNIAVDWWLITLQVTWCLTSTNHVPV